MDTTERIDLQGEAGLPYINRGVYTGSYRGLRYRMSKETRVMGEGETAEEKKVLQLVIYPEPFSFENTPEEKREYHDFPFTDEGFSTAVEFLNEQYRERREYWEEVLKNRFR